MPKTSLTEEIENVLLDEYKRMYACREVTIGMGTAVHGRVDIMVMDSKDIIRCFEIKVTVADFRSPCISSFDGHYNYYVMPLEVYEKVENEIPTFVGVFIYSRMHLSSVKKAIKQKLSSEKVEVMKSYLIRSLSREANRYYEIKNESTVTTLKRKIKALIEDRDNYQKSRDKYCTRLVALENDLDEIYGEDFKAIVKNEADKKRTERRKQIS